MPSVKKSRYETKFLQDGSLNPHYRYKKRGPKQPIKEPDTEYLSDGITKNPYYKEYMRYTYVPSRENNTEAPNKINKKYSDDVITPNPLLKPKKQVSSDSEKIDECKSVLAGVEHESYKVAFEKFIKNYPRMYKKIMPTSSPINATLHFLETVYAHKNAGMDVNIDSAIDTVFYELNCINCGCTLKDTREYLFCSELCQQEAQLVRYMRRVIEDNRVWDMSIQEQAIGVRLLMLSGGGYSYSERTVPKDVRAYIFERDKNTCQICGQAGSEIDHIDGNSCEPDNLQVLCKACNISKIKVKNITPDNDVDEYQKLYQLYNKLATRVASTKPTKICDYDTVWVKICQKLRSVRLHMQD